MTAIEPRYFQLPATATYARRRFGWFAGEGQHADGRIGTLRVILYPTSGEARVDEYGVFAGSASQPAYFNGPRAFALAKDDGTHPTMVAASHACTIATNWSRCSCKAGQTGQSCKHADTLRKLIDEKVI